MAEDTAIFGRVSPHQKKLLIQTLNANVYTTAMTGDGQRYLGTTWKRTVRLLWLKGIPLHVRLPTWCLWIRSLRIFLKFNLRNVVWLIILPTLQSIFPHQNGLFLPFGTYLYCQYCFWKGRVPLGLPIHSGSDDFGGAIYRGSSTIYFDL